MEVILFLTEGVLGSFGFVLQQHDRFTQCKAQGQLYYITLLLHRLSGCPFTPGLILSVVSMFPSPQPIC